MRKVVIPLLLVLASCTKIVALKQVKDDNRHAQAPAPIPAPVDSSYTPPATKIDVKAIPSPQTHNND